jgi:hypothetical protein
VLRTFVAFCLVAAACGSTSTERRPDPRELAFLQVGVDPAVEAEAVAAALSRAGFRVRTRVDGDRFTALSFVHRQDATTAIRVITSRGVALALDAAGADAPLDLLAPPERGDHRARLDVDGDGHDEVVVRATDAALARDCLQVLRISEDGVVRDIPARGDLPSGPCIETLHDVNADGAADAIAVIRFPDLARDHVPSLAVPLIVRDGSWSPAGRAAAVHFDDQRTARRSALATARDQVDVEHAYRLAVELAAIERFTGADTPAQIAAFDTALSGLVVDEPQSRAIAAARAAIAAGWR